jgi:hypothetical protein
MLFSSVLVTAALYASSVAATALTFKLAANEKACFFTDVQQKSAKIAFYFAVSYFCVIVRRRWMDRTVSMGSEGVGV